MKTKTFYYGSYKIVYGTYENATERITGYYVLALGQIYKTLQSAESAIDNHTR